MTREINTGKATAGQFVVSYQRNGYGGVIPVIDGVQHPELMMGYVSESDCEAGLKLLEEALKATSGDIPKAMRYMYNACTMAANDIKADEAVEIDGVELIISYERRKAYLGTEEIADANDEAFGNLSREAVKVLLMERAKVELERRIREFDETVDNYWDEYNDAPYEED